MKFKGMETLPDLVKIRTTAERLDRQLSDERDRLDAAHAENSLLLARAAQRDLDHATELHALRTALDTEKVHHRTLLEAVAQRLSAPTASAALDATSVPPD